MFKALAASFIELYLLVMLVSISRTSIFWQEDWLLPQGLALLLADILARTSSLWDFNGLFSPFLDSLILARVSSENTAENLALVSSECFWPILDPATFNILYSGLNWSI